MKFRHLFNIDIEKVPFSSLIDNVVFYGEYEKAPLIPDLNLFLQSKFPSQTIDESFDMYALESAEREFYTRIRKKDLPDQCSKPDIKQTPTFIILDQLKKSYDLFLADISTNQNPEPRTEIIKDHLAKLSPKNQLSIINHMITDESLSIQLITGKMVLQHEKKRPAQFWGEPEVYVPKLLPYEIVSQRLEDFKNKLISYKNTPSKKPTKQQPVKEFKEFFANKENAVVIDHFKQLLTDESKNKKDRGRIIRYMEIEKLFDPAVQLALKDFIKSFYGSRYTERIYDAMLRGFNAAKPTSKGELSPYDKKLKDSVLNPFNPPTDSAD